MMVSTKPILLVEDDYVDVMAVRRVLKEFHVPNELTCAENGEEALGYLRNETKERPCLILLDLNMPKMSGLEFLKALRADEVLKDTPVIVVTTSPDEQDRSASLALGAVAYVLKSNRFEEFRQKMALISSYLPVPKPEMVGA